MYRNLLKLIQDESAFVSIIPSSDLYHPALCTLVGIYVNLPAKNISFIIPVDHPEMTEQIQVSEICEYLKNAKELFCLDKKYFYYFLQLNNLKDIKSSVTFQTLPSHSYTLWMQNKFKNYGEINKIIPLAKLLEKYNNEFSTVKDICVDFKYDDGYTFTNNIATPVFYLIEKHGLRISYQPFLDIFKPNIPELNIRDNIVYTQYNLYNQTSRPTNSFNGVNYAAIPRKSDYRKCFLPQNDLFVEFDFDGYHIRLLAEQVGYELTPEPAHIQLGRLYFNKQDLSPDEYTQAKQINFQALYGHTPDDYKDFKLFKMIEKWTDILWDEFNTAGYVNVPISNKRFYNNIHGMYPKKLLNYIIQALETARNITILKNALQFLNTKKTKIALYTYDSILLDFSKDDGKHTLLELENLLSENSKYPVKFKYSKNLVFD